MKHKRSLISITLAALVLVSLFAAGSSTASVSGQASGTTASLATNMVGGTMTGTGPSVCTSYYNYNTYVFVVNSNGTLWFNSSGSWQSIGGVSTSSPAAVSWNPYYSKYLRLDAFVRGTDGALWYKYYQNGWSSWQSLGGKLAPGTGPAACSWSEGRLDVFVTGTDVALYHRWYNGATWSRWQKLGGYLTSSPAAAVPLAGGNTVSNKIDVFVRGTDSAVWWRQWNGAAWSGWTSLGGKVERGTGPAVNHYSYRLFVQGVDHQLWERDSGTSWTEGSWRTLAGAPPEALSTSSPASTNVITMDHTLVCVSTTSGNIWGSSESLTNYQHWYPMGSPP